MQKVRGRQRSHRVAKAAANGDRIWDSHSLGCMERRNAMHHHAVFLASAFRTIERTRDERDLMAPREASREVPDHDLQTAGVRGVKSIPIRIRWVR
jgi:hypothetical protein